jgi:hypothetical protein
MVSPARPGAGSRVEVAIMNSLTILRLRPMLRLLPHSRRSDCPRVPPCHLPVGQTMSTPLDRGSTVPLCAVCIEAGRATEATYQTRDGLCGCDQHNQQLEQHGRAAVRRQRSAEPHGYMDRGAPPARGTSGGSVGPSDDRVGGRKRLPRLSDGHGGTKRSRQPTHWTAGQAKPS